MYHHYDYLTKIINNIKSILPDNEILYKYNEYFNIAPLQNEFKQDIMYTEHYYNSYKKIKYKNKPLILMSEYDSFYPESFYFYWEILHKFKSINESNHRFAFIDDNNSTINSLGHIESVMKYCEDNFYYENNTYIRLPLNKPIINQTDKQFVKIYNNQQLFEFIKSTYANDMLINIQKYFQNDKFDFVISTTNDIIKNLLLLLILKQHSNAIIYIDNIYDKSQIAFMKFVSLYFKKMTIYRPQIQHPLVLSGYMILESFTGNNLDNVVKCIMTSTIDDNNHQMIDHRIKNNYIQHISKLLNFYKYIEYDENDQYKNNININNSVKWLLKHNLTSKSYYINEPNFDYTQQYTSYIFKFNNTFKFTDTFKFNDILIKPNDCFKDIKANDYYMLKYDHLHKIKCKLNTYKRIIDTKEQFINNDIDEDIIDWNKLNNCIDMYKNLKRYIIWKCNSEMVTNTWIKFYEILSHENIISQLDDQGKLKTFHLCETSGALIAALNHYITTCTKINYYHWYAQTLNPNVQQYMNKKKPLQSMENEYNLSNLIDTYPNKWLFGHDRSGDLINKTIIADYVHDYRLMHLDLITGDGNFKIPVDKFNEQESYVAQLIFHEFMTCLQLLSVGKTCIIKAFLPLVENFTVSFMYLLTMLFKELKIIKPHTSNSSSSEVYILCCDYIGFNHIPQNIKDRLNYCMDHFDVTNSIFPEKLINNDFINELKVMSTLFCHRQIESIKRSLYYRYNYYQNIDLQNDLSLEKEKHVSRWFEETGIQKITKQHIIK